jgi:hypothetical protein
MGNTKTERKQGGCYKPHKRQEVKNGGINTYMGDGVGVRVPVGASIFSSPRRPDLLSNGYRGVLSPGLKRQGREADHSHPYSVEVKIIFFYKSTPPYAFLA